MLRSIEAVGSGSGQSQSSPVAAAWAEYGRTEIPPPRVVESRADENGWAYIRLDVPGVSLGIVQEGKIMFLARFGVRELGKPAKVDGDTKFTIASNTKPLTTLLLAKLVQRIGDRGGRMTGSNS